MRKYTGLMVVVFVLLGAGFLFTMNDIGTGSGVSGGSGPTVLEVHGQSIDQQSYSRMGEQTLQLCSEAGLHNYINFLMAPDAQQMQQALQLGRFGYNYFTMMRNNLTATELNRFVANRIILKRAITEMGLYASEDEVTEAIKSLPTFSSGGKYSEAAYTLFAEKRLGRMGMTERHLRDLVRENLCLNKLVNIVGGGLAPSRSATQDMLEAQMQTVTLAKVTFQRDDFVEKENPSEEEVKAYWEAHQDAYKTDEQRRISYLLLTLPEDADEAATEDDKAEAEPKNEEEAKAKAQAKAAEETQKRELRATAAKALTRQIQELYDSIIESENEKLPLDFKAIVEKHDHQVTESELFTRAKLPAELQGLTLRGSSNQNRPLSEDIFKMKKSDNAYNNVSAPLPVGEHGWVVFVLEEVVEPELLDYDAARAKARAQLIGENATEKVKLAAEEARSAVLELMKAGKDFDTAVREKGLTPVQVGPFASSTPPQDEPSAQQLHGIAAGLNPGEVSEVINEADRSLFFLVEKRELEDTEENKLRVDNAVQGAEMDLMIRTFLNWINHQYQKAEVKAPAV
ncbi:SurA N-terminal domain-containing protein [Verrucomicrobiaceae bacterium R5-34]|nr:SurA N-terminal domain-containing protein [Verrucomicrobiaceae bacterium R5-34]